MTDFNNSTFKKSIGSASQPQGQQPLRQWTVPDAKGVGDASLLNSYSGGDDPSFDPQAMRELEQSVKTARQQKVSGESRISPSGKQRMELLADIGRLTREVEIGGIRFSLRTLKTRETREVALAAFSANIKTDLEASYEMRRQQLARSIHKIDGHEVGLVLGDDSFAARLDWIDNDLEESVALKLFAEMNALNEEARSQFDIKTDAQAKEVAEDLKK